MDFTTILNYFFYYFVPGVVGLLILYFLSKRLYKTAQIHLGLKKFVKQSIKLDKKKFNGVDLTEKIKRKRKRHTNSYHHLRRRAKRMVKKYLNHKVDELPAFAKYAYGKLYKRANNKVMIYIKRDRKTLDKFPMKRGMKKLVEIIDKYQCLDEFLVFLHYLPQAIVEKRDYAIDGTFNDIFITYSVK